jgi:hypothetical protein
MATTNRRRLCIGAIALATTHAAAAGDWQYELTPYVFASGMQGDVKVGRIPATGIEADFADLAKALDYGFMGNLVARKGDVGYLVDVIYMKVTDGGDTPGRAFGEAHASMTQQMYSGAAIWRVSPAAVDLLLGVRYLHLKADLDIGAGVLSGRRAKRDEKHHRCLRGPALGAHALARVGFHELRRRGRGRLETELSAGRGRGLHAFEGPHAQGGVPIHERRLQQGRLPLRHAVRRTLPRGGFPVLKVG